MNLTLTLVAQIITFVFLVWFVNAKLWGPMTKMLEDRKTRIAEGLAAAERGRHEQELAEKRAEEHLREAKQQAAEIIAQAQKRASEIVEEAKNDAVAEGNRLKAAAEAEIEQEANRAREQLRGQVVQLAIVGAGRVLEREVDASAHDKALADLVAQI
ncbi:F0F1 ATP synthase subunit B [Acidihalobacter ferrooxydans]|uniref:ATP synthase subunit b n=1 Tax=Acidihalobacter ferrooxydans TaxID=1765967 RepID=A0A1P8UKT7_9GAMM|nr:F0F1 ATP synthase subunit B [Acidihalobacter ferrooxydans]APZ44425.1 F0F1 ATP synthase subunit B [Acidihalobacter ferrooxydans]